MRFWMSGIRIGWPLRFLSPRKWFLADRPSLPARTVTKPVFQPDTEIGVHVDCRVLRVKCRTQSLMLPSGGASKLLAAGHYRRAYATIFFGLLKSSSQSKLFKRATLP